MSNQILTGTISRPSCFIICVELVIHDFTCGFRPVISTRQNVISQGLPIFGTFCKPLRNVVTETSAEPSANWEVRDSKKPVPGQNRNFANKMKFLQITQHRIANFAERISKHFNPMQTAPHQFMTQKDGTVLPLHQLLCGLRSIEISQKAVLKNRLTLCPVPITLNCLFCRSGAPLFMEILYARVRHIIDMNQGIQMLNAV